MLKTEDFVEMTSAPIDGDDLLTIGELAAKMKISRWKVRDLYQHEGMPKVDLNGTYRFDWTAIRAWIQTRISSTMN